MIQQLLSKVINTILSRIGFMLVRKSTVDSLVKKKETVKTFDYNGLQEKINSYDFSNQKLLLDHQLINNKLDQLIVKLDDQEKQSLRNQITLKWDVIDHINRNLYRKTNLTCALCNHTNDINSFKVFESHCIFGGGRLTRYQCPDCEVVFGDQKMLNLNPQELSQDYELHYRVYQEGDSTPLEIRAFHLLKPHKKGVYLNYGAGAWSKSVQALRAEGWNVYAYEPHGSAVSNEDFFIRTKKQLSEMEFDGVFSNNVLEHFRYPVDDLSFIRSLLKPNGLMAHATPCFEYLYEFTRFHLFFFLGKSRQLLADKANVNIVDFEVDGEFMCAVYKAES